MSLVAVLYLILHTVKFHDCKHSSWAWVVHPISRANLVMQYNETADSSKADCWSALHDPDFLMSAVRHPFPSFAASACTSFGPAHHHLRASAQQEIWDTVAANEAGMLLHLILLNLLQSEALGSALAMPILSHAQNAVNRPQSIDFGTIAQWKEL